MFGKKDSTFRRDHFWGSCSTKISDARIELKDGKNTIIAFATESDQISGLAAYTKILDLSQNRFPALIEQDPIRGFS